MRINAASGARGNIFDRNPTTATTFGEFEAFGLAPAGNTTRWTYTVPSNRKASIDALHMLTQRSTAATTSAQVAARITGNVTLVRHIEHGFTDNALYRTYLSDVGFSGVYVAGDGISAQTQDISTGGTVDYFIDGRFMEFDA